MAGGSQGHEPKKAKVAKHHPDAADDALSPTASTKCHFISLPYGLREMIYNEHFRDSRISEYSLNKSGSGGVKMAAAKVKEILPFMSSCRTIYKEATPILAKNTTLRIAYLPHIQRITLAIWATPFNPADLPNLKQVSLYDGANLNINVSESSIADMVPYVVGDKDLFYIGQRSSDAEGPIWNVLKALNATVRFQIDLVVYLWTTNTSNGALTRVMMVELDLKTSQVYERVIQGHRTGPVDHESVRKSLVRWEMTGGDPELWHLMGPW